MWLNRRAFSLLCTCLWAAACSARPDSNHAAGAKKIKHERPTPVRVGAVTEGNLVVRSVYPGELRSDSVELSAKSEGRIEAVTVRIGDRVKEGQLVAELDRTGLRRQQAEAKAAREVARASAERAKAQLGAAQRELERTEPLQQQKIVSAQQIDTLKTRIDTARAELEIARAQIAQSDARLALISVDLKEARIVAPFEAVVAERYLDPGAIAQPGKPILRLVATAPLRVSFRVPERDLAGVEVGLSFLVETEAARGKTFEGHVSRMAGEVSRSDRSLAVEGIVESPSTLLRPGMFAKVRLSQKELHDVKLVPAAGVVERVGADHAPRSGVFVTKKETATFVPVTVLGRTGDQVAIDGKISVGDRVVVLGHDGLSDGSRVQVEDTVALDRGESKIERESE